MMMHLEKIIYFGWNAITLIGFLLIAGQSINGVLPIWLPFYIWIGFARMLEAGQDLDI